MTKGVRRYKEVMLWFHRDERIETKEETVLTESFHPVETLDYVRRISLPSHLGNKINILI